MSPACPLTRQLYDAITTTDCEYTRLQFLPGNDPLVVVKDSENSTLEIGISKKHYLRIFTEGHSFLNGQYPNKNQCEEFAISELENVYFATISLIITTNDHSTVWRVHEEALWELHRRSAASAWIEHDLQFCTALTTSKLDKINKSPLLWHWMKKISVIYIFHDYTPEKFYALLVQIRRSMDAHYANYAAGYTFVWCVKIARFLQKSFEERKVIEILRTSCRKSLSDNSLWTAFAGVLSTTSDVFATTMYRRIVEELQNNGVISNSEPSDNHDGHNCPTVEVTNAVYDSWCELLETHGIEEIDWLLNIKCLVKLPYEKLTGLVIHSTRSRELLRERREALEAANARGEPDAKRLLEVLFEG